MRLARQLGLSLLTQELKYYYYYSSSTHSTHYSNQSFSAPSFLLLRQSLISDSPLKSLHTLLNIRHLWFITTSFLHMKEQKLLKKGYGKKKKRCEVPSFSFPVSQSVLRPVAMIHQSNANSSTSAELQSSSLQNTGWPSAENLHQKTHAAELASPVRCKFSHIDVMTLHACSLTHKLKNTQQAGRHKENQTSTSAEKFCRGWTRHFSTNSNRRYVLPWCNYILLQTQP